MEASLLLTYQEMSKWKFHKRVASYLYCMGSSRPTDDSTDVTSHVCSVMLGVTDDDDDDDVNRPISFELIIF